jgi:aspartate/methionine/tyrosine aminotransferase
MTYEIAEKHDVFLYSDEIYARMIYDNAKFSSPGIFDKCKERTIISNGFSKAFAMTGWRLGAVIGPSNVIEKMRLLLETTSSCVSPFIQVAGMEAIGDNQKGQKIMYDEYLKRRDIITSGINSIDGLSCIKPGGAFYVFVNIKKTGMTSETFCEYMLEDAGVAMLPGTSFGQFGEGFIRICYAVGQDEINNAFEKIKKSISRLDL